MLSDRFDLKFQGFRRVVNSPINDAGTTSFAVPNPDFILELLRNSGWPRRCRVTAVNV